MKEEWKDIKGYEGMYQVSNFGRVKSLARIKVINGIDRQTKEMFLKQAVKDGYMRVRLCKNSKHTNSRVHRLVAEAFIPNPENKPQVNHKNGVKSHNRVENLEWSTHSENQIHAHRTGLKIVRDMSGENNNISILKNKDIPVIRELRKTMRIVDIAKKYGVKPVTISDIIHRRRWGHVE